MTRIQFIRSWLLARPPGSRAGFLWGCAAVALPTGIRASIDGLVSGTTFAAYYPFVMASAMVMGWRRATAVMLASALVANFLFMQPRYTLFQTWSDTAGAATFVFSSMLMIALAETLRRTVAELEARRNSEAHLNRELQHRVKNTIAVIQGLATQTFRDPASEPELRKFEGRLRALANANDVLQGGQWETCRLPDLAVRALEPFNKEGSIRLYGPACALREESCVPLVLALHELATNAVKYGALSTAAGGVELLWALGADGGDLVLEWTERGGPPVEPPTRRGLGSRLLRPRRGIADVQLAFPVQGVSCRFHVTGTTPLPEAA